MGVYLKKVCPSFNNLKLSTIKDNFLFDLRDNEKFMPLDCLIELGKLCETDIDYFKDHIKKIRFKNTKEMFSISLDRLK